MGKCLKSEPPITGRISIEFSRECLDCVSAQVCAGAEENTIKVNVHLAEDLQPSATPPQMMQLITRIMVAILGTVSSDMKDVLYNACHCSSNVAEELQSFLNDHYSVKIHIDAPSEDTN